MLVPHLRNSNRVKLMSSLLASDPIPKLVKERQALETRMSVSPGLEMDVVIRKTLEHELKK